MWTDFQARQDMIGCVLQMRVAESGLFYSGLAPDVTSALAHPHQINSKRLGVWSGNSDAASSL